MAPMTADRASSAVKTCDDRQKDPPKKKHLKKFKHRLFKIHLNWEGSNNLMLP